MRNIFNSKYSWLILLLILIGINFLAAKLHSRIDLTKEKRYTLSKTTKDLLRNLDAPVHIDVFMQGSYPAGFKKLVNSVEEFLQECREYAGSKLTISFSDPLKGADDSAAQHYIDSIGFYYDIAPYTLESPSKVGDELTIKRVLPGAVVHYGDSALGVNFLKGIRNYGKESEQLAALYNSVEATLEYKFGSAIQKITSKTKPAIAYLLGNGEAFGYNINDAFVTLRQNYSADTFNLRSRPFIPPSVDAIVILKPTLPFTDQDKMKIDQYVMHGGKIFWMIDNMYADFESLRDSTNGFIAYDRALNLEDILFKYGVRLNQNLLQDMQCDKLGQLSGDPNNPQTQLVDWPFFPILDGTDHPISKNLDGVRAMFPNTLDTVSADGIKKTFLLRSSTNARVLPAPAKVDFEFLQIAPDIKQFTVHDTAVAALLEGNFTSLYNNRMPRSFIDSMKNYNVEVKTVSEKPTKMIVVADGDIAMNQVSQQYGPMPMGYNFYTRYMYANKDFFLNSIEYLVNPSNILETRAKEFTLRLLDAKKVREQKTTWQFVNIALPVLLIILFGFGYQQLRKRKYAK